MWYVYAIQYYPAKKEWILTTYDNMDGHRGYQAKWKRLNRERQISHGFCYLWNLRKQRKKESRQKQVHRNRKHIDDWQIGKGLGAEVKKGMN